MRLSPLSQTVRPGSFAAGLAFGLTISAVAYAASRKLRRRTYDVDLTKTFIDGAKPINPVDLTVQVAEEATSEHCARVEGELGDPPARSQRW